LPATMTLSAILRQLNSIKDHGKMRAPATVLDAAALEHSPDSPELGSRLIKSTVQERGEADRGPNNFAPAW
jgi:hypothetical protein